MVTAAPRGGGLVSAKKSFERTDEHNRSPPDLAGLDLFQRNVVFDAAHRNAQHQSSFALTHCKSLKALQRAPVVPIQFLRDLCVHVRSVAQGGC
jgi:hypothetical protein